MNSGNDNHEMQQQLIVELQILRTILMGIGEAQRASVEQQDWPTRNEHYIPIAPRQSNMPAPVNFNNALDRVLDHLIAFACKLLNADAASIYRLEEPDGVMLLRAVGDIAAKDVVVSVPSGRELMNHAVIQRRPILASSETATGNEASEPSVGQDLGVAWAALVPWYVAVLVIPLVTSADVFGVLVLFQRSASKMMHTDSELAQAVGDYVALAIDNARWFEAAQHYVRLDERQRLARDLHDTVTQALYVVKLYAEAAIRRVAADDGVTATDYLRELRSTAQEALQEMRLLIFELRPPILEQEGLVAALQARLEAVEERAGLESEFSLIGDHRPIPPVEQALYRVTQEALNNVLKHAHARKVSIVLSLEPHQIQLTIGDDGVGFDPAAPTVSHGLGICGMQERVKQIGGRLSVESTVGVGTVVRVEVHV